MPSSMQIKPLSLITLHRTNDPSLSFTLHSYLFPFSLTKTRMILRAMRDRALGGKGGTRSPHILLILVHSRLISPPTTRMHPNFLSLLRDTSSSRLHARLFPPVHIWQISRGTYIPLGAQLRTTLSSTLSPVHHSHRG